MNINIELETGNWLLVAGSRSIVPTLLKMTARLAETGPVRVVDCGCMFDFFIAGTGTRGGLDVLNRIKVSNAFNVNQTLAVLADLESGPQPFVVLDMLRPFFYASVSLEERKRVLGACLEQLNRLEKGAGGLVSVHPPQVLCQAESELLEMVKRAADTTYLVEMAARLPASVRVS